MKTFQGVSLDLFNVQVDPIEPRVTFTVTMDILATQPPSDGDGEVFNQQFGFEVLKQLIAKLQEV